MSWLVKAFESITRAESESDEEEEDQVPSPRESPSTSAVKAKPSGSHAHGVRDDITELKDTLARRLQSLSSLLPVFNDDDGDGDAEDADRRESGAEDEWNRGWKNDDWAEDQPAAGEVAVKSKQTVSTNDNAVKGTGMSASSADHQEPEALVAELVSGIIRKIVADAENDSRDAAPHGAKKPAAGPDAIHAKSAASSPLPGTSQKKVSGIRSDLTEFATQFKKAFHFGGGHDNVLAPRQVGVDTRGAGSGQDDGDEGQGGPGRLAVSRGRGEGARSERRRPGEPSPSKALSSEGSRSPSPSSSSSSSSSSSGSDTDSRLGSSSDDGDGRDDDDYEQEGGVTQPGETTPRAQEVRGQCGEGTPPPQTKHLAGSRLASATPDARSDPQGARGGGRGGSVARGSPASVLSSRKSRSESGRDGNDRNERGQKSARARERSSGRAGKHQGFACDDGDAMGAESDDGDDDGHDGAGGGHVTLTLHVTLSTGERATGGVGGDGVERAGAGDGHSLVHFKGGDAHGNDMPKGVESHSYLRSGGDEDGQGNVVDDRVALEDGKAGRQDGGDSSFGIRVSLGVRGEGGGEKGQGPEGGRPQGEKRGVKGNSGKGKGGTGKGDKPHGFSLALAAAAHHPASALRTVLREDIQLLKSSLSSSLSTLGGFAHNFLSSYVFESDGGEHDEEGRHSDHQGRYSDRGLAGGNDDDYDDDDGGDEGDDRRWVAEREGYWRQGEGRGPRGGADASGGDGEGSAGGKGRGGHARTPGSARRAAWSHQVEQERTPLDVRQAMAGGGFPEQLPQEFAGVPGLNEDTATFAANVALHPETWLMFPVTSAASSSTPFTPNASQSRHLAAMQALVPGIAALRAELCPAHLDEGEFWKIYFVLLHSRLRGDDVAQLSSPQVLAERESLLQCLKAESRAAGGLEESASTSHDEGGSALHEGSGSTHREGVVATSHGDVSVGGGQGSTHRQGSPKSARAAQGAEESEGDSDAASQSSIPRRRKRRRNHEVWIR
eukprot:jgi/Mesvir1/3461/Mv11955-RA.1